MSSLQSEVIGCFAPEGTMSSKVPGFVARPSQVEMAERVAQAIGQGSSLVVEAGTGTGKTFAYLVPALLSGKKVLISTATKTLQDQLFNKDLPLVREALEVPVNVALLKGRQNYVCHFYLEKTLLDGRMASTQDVQHLQAVKRFAQASQSGDKSDCEGVPETSAVWPLVTSNRDNCLGSECSFAVECFVNKARKKALESELVVINHHLFFADVALKEEGVAELLPAADLVVFDEAHQLPDIATLLLGQSVSTSQFRELLRDLLVEGRASASDAGDWVELVSPLETDLKEIRLLCGAEVDSASFSLSQFQAIEGLVQRCTQFGQALENLLDQLEPLAPRSESWMKLNARTADLCHRWQKWMQGVPQDEVTGSSDFVRWVSVSAHHVQFCESPLDVSQAFGSVCDESDKAWVFTSATLSVKNDLSHFSQKLGLGSAQTLLLQSPFNYPDQGLLCVPSNLPWPNSPGFSEQLCECLWPLLQASDGGVFFLCTSHRAVRRVAFELRDRIASESLDWQLLVQGEASRARLIEQFGKVGKPVLVGAASFWEGVDIRGRGLRLVIIDKLPFAPPDDPVFQARSDKLRSEGGNPFIDISVPEAAIALKQGAGRLIRDEKDWGVLVIGDRRLVEKSYGQRLWRSLPPFSRTKDLAEAVQFLETHIHPVET